MEIKKYLSYHNASKHGFTLIEVLVALSLFVTIASIALSVLFSLSTANRKSQATRDVADNIAFVFEDIASEARWGKFFTCKKSFELDPEPCPAGSKSFSFLSVRDLPADLPYIENTLGGQENQVSYMLTDGIIQKAYGSNEYQPLSSPKVQIENLTFYVYGNAKNDNERSRVLVSVTAVVNKGTNAESKITLQTTITQRLQE